MADKVKQILAKPIKLADQVSKAAEEACSFKQDCAELKSRTEKLAALLRQAARTSSDLYERPTRRIVDDTGQVLEKALAIALKCRAHGVVKRVFTIISAASFRKMQSQLDNSIGDVSWLLRVSASADERVGEHLGLPPIAANEPILCLIWEQIAILHTGSADDKSDAAASLVSLARDNDRYGKLIVEEGGVGPLLKLLKEGKVEGQENAARAIGLLGRDPAIVEHMVHAGVCQVFDKMLQEGPMKVQAVLAWAISELASHFPKCQDLFAQNNVVRLLVGHIAFDTVLNHSKYAIPSKATSIHALVLASNENSLNKNNARINDNGDEDHKSRIAHPMENNRKQTQNHNVVMNTLAMRNTAKKVHFSSHHHYSHARELEDPATKAYMKAMAARALWHLCKDNPQICHSITESRAMLCFAALLEKGPDDVQYNSAMVVMEITAVAEKDADLRRSAFKPSSPACKAVVDQMLRIIEEPVPNLLVPCVRTIGNLARTFRSTETRMISPLVKLLEDQETEVSNHAAVSLVKFACTENYLHMDHSKAIIASGGAKHLVQLVYFGGPAVRGPALALLCYIAKHVPDCEELAKAEVLMVLEWVAKQQGFLVQDEKVETLLQEAKSRVELYQSKGVSGFAHY
ncbi:unnamed protein product [Cuscuta campestris]|uniref:DUF7792 domain-containing protein n=1 Tax=Cuscuta campestris TaxID=132261 RepID=A0A484MX86_9ASTE|nr:unnamed protein product [Cuscuta campestris]